MTVSFSLTDPVRTSRSLNIPAYRCEGGGDVVVEITVNRAGEVVNARVQSGGDEVLARIGPACGAGFALQYRPVGPCAPAGDDYVHFYPAISSFCPAGVGYSAEIVNFAEVNSGSDRAVSPAAIRAACMRPAPSLSPAADRIGHA